LGIKTLEIPEKVGGRFSALSPVGLFPLLCAGVDVEALLHGAEDMLGKCISDNLKKNVAMQSAAVLYLLRKKGKTIHTTFMFHPELRSLADWYRQLLAESIGKKENNRGDIIQVGITPETAVGSTDLHSMGQLYLGGPKDKLTTFVSAHTLGGIVSVPENRVFPSIVKSIHDRSAEEVMDAILKGTKEAYIKGELPFMEIEFEDVSPYELGSYMQFKMCEIMYLGKLLNINAFNQPNVEDYKIETKSLLEGK
jgi:glucose-6-phosphate isomerase